MASSRNVNFYNINPSKSTMLEKTTDYLFVPFLLSAFFLAACSYNLAYFGTFGDSLLYFLYIPMSFFDLLRTGLTSLLLLSAFLIIFKPFLVNPVFRGVIPGPRMLFGASLIVLVTNIVHSIAFSGYYTDKSYSLISEGLFYTFFIVCFFGILYYFLRERSKELLLVVFLLSLIPISCLIGWANASFDAASAPSEAKSKILLKNDKVISVKVLRSFEKGILVITGINTGINFIAWDEIQEMKFKKVSGL